MVAINDFRASQYPETDDLRCVEIYIPDDPVFFNLLAGLLYLPTKAFNYQGDTFEHRGKLAEMWRAAYDKTDWEGCMDCAGVAECIADNSDVQDAIAEAITENTNIQTAISNVFNPDVAGSSASDEYRNKNQAPDDMSCDQNIAWGRIRDGLVDRSFQRVIDVLEEIELTTDNQEMLAKSLDAIPFLGEALQFIGISAWLAWFDNVRNFLKDAFDAGDTLETRDQIACDLWCIYLENCSLSFEQISQYFYQRTIDNFPTFEDAFTDFTTLIEAMANPTELVGDLVVDVLLACEFGFQSFINSWFGVKIGTCGSDLLFGTPNEGWLSACEDCPDTWSKEWDFRIDPYEWAVVSGNGEWVDGEGFRNVIASANPYAVYIKVNSAIDPGSTITAWRVEAYSETADGSADRSWQYQPGTVNQDINTGQTGEWNMSGLLPFDTPESEQLGITNFVIPGTNIIRKIRLSGTGIEPVWS